MPTDSIVAHRIAAGATWGAWFFSHVKEINEFLQLIVLVLAIVSSVMAFWRRKK